MNRKLLERDVEAYFCDQVRRLGGFPVKIKASSVRGVPDQVAVLPHGVVRFAELKRPGEEPRADQLRIHRKFGERGSTVAVLDTMEAVDAWIADMAVVIEAGRLSGDGDNSNGIGGN